MQYKETHKTRSAFDVNDSRNWHKDKDDGWMILAANKHRGVDEEVGFRQVVV